MMRFSKSGLQGHILLLQVRRAAWSEHAQCFLHSCLNSAMYSADEILKDLAEDKLQQFADRVQTRMLNKEETKKCNTTSSFKTMVYSKADRFRKLLEISGERSVAGI